MDSWDKFWRFVFTVIFGGAVAWLGVQEIYRRHGHGETDEEQMARTRKLVRDLQGDREVERASFSPESVKKMQEEEREKDPEDPVPGGNLKSPWRTMLDWWNSQPAPKPPE